MSRVTLFFGEISVKKLADSNFESGRVESLIQPKCRHAFAVDIIVFLQKFDIPEAVVRRLSHFELLGVHVFIPIVVVIPQIFHSNIDTCKRLAPIVS
ncbi:hypothetical protein [Microbulbifer halophilus]|uniref:Uncharacterized protein n=1 Tax=Microbulbifer halophilus TaxID=453963 RepID=A0ABW5ED78_9GAMM|nr:hypothetical protein [Microbulbifer halophilus]MCW8126262.1 hypothetical protein [Microbulbifer halophilus]